MSETPETEDVLARRVAHFVKGTEVYGVGSVQKLYAEHAPGLLFVHQEPGAMTDWLAERDARRLDGGGGVRFQISGSLAALARGPLALRQAKRDADRVEPLLRREGIDLLHVHWLPHLFVAGHLRRRGFKVAFHVHNNTNPRRLAGLGIRINWRIVRWAADAIIPVSDFIRANWEPSGVPCRVIRNVAVPVHDGPPGPREPSPLRLLTAGRLTEEKGHHVAVEAVAALRDAGRDVRLDCFGGGGDTEADRAYERRLKELAGDHLHDDGVRLMGLRRDLRQRHRDYHLGVQARLDPEPCSVWVCETLVDGLPLLASATGGTPELVVDGVVGRLYPPGDAAALRSQIESVLDDPSQIARWSAAAYERGREHFRVDRLIAETRALYADLLRDD